MLEWRRNLERNIQSRNLSNARLASLTKIPEKTIENWRNQSEMKIGGAIKIANALGITLEELCLDRGRNTNLRVLEQLTAAARIHSQVEERLSPEVEKVADVEKGQAVERIRKKKLKDQKAS